MKLGSGEERYLPAAFDGSGAHDFEQRIGSKLVDLLIQNIAGGIVGCYLKKGYPLYYISSNMLEFLGYSYAAYQEIFGKGIIGSVHPVDRDLVRDTVKAALQNDQQFEVQYRIRNQSGNFFWVNAIGRKQDLEGGGAVCICVVRNISAEVIAKQQLMVNTSEQESQALRYDTLFQSVLCGIVQYSLAGNANVSFRNANQEAIRIFGYEPDEFWAKTEWNLASFIATEDRERVLRQTSNLKNVGDKGFYEYRLRKKNGESCWILGSAEIIQSAEGEVILQSVFLDINSRKQAELLSQRLSEQVTASYELLTLALEHTSTCEFYYYPQTRHCVLPDKTSDSYMCKSQYRGMPDTFAAEAIAETSLEDFKDSYARIHQGDRTASVEIQMKKSGIWCRQTLSAISYTEAGKPSFVIGIIEDITKQKEMEAALCEARSRDGLTGLYNKETGVQMVQSYLLSKSPDEVCGLLLLDMDDFEAVNREEGNVFADAILQEVADILRAETEPDDIQIRLGGDEFMLFVKNCDRARAAILGPRIANLVKTIFLPTEKELRITVSIGMCVTAVVEEYQALYRCAESTLKYIKEHGKCRAACYLDTSNELGIFLTQIYTEEHLVNAIDGQAVHREEDLVSFALELLGKSKNLDDAVFLLLARIGKSFHFDRVSILEANRDYLSYRFTYQWARNRAQLQLAKDIYVTVEEFDLAAGMYNEEGLCDHNINDTVSEIASCLHAGIWNYGAYTGSMSFEIDVKDYCWTVDQRKLLKELVKLVPSFLMKARADAVSQAKTDFLSRMSHEIRTPMNAISGMTTIAKSVLGDQEQTLSCLNKIESANIYLLALINDVLDMSRIESGKLELNYESANLAIQCESLDTLLRPQAEVKQIFLRFELNGTGEYHILADKLRLDQVLVNIIGNAIKFTPPQGRITVCFTPVSADKKGVVIHFSVTDTGIGIEPSAMDRIFNAFEQAQINSAAQCGGTGLGLSISNRLVQMMGGTLEVRSTVGIGSEFFFTLPFEFSAAHAVPTAHGEEEASAFDFTGKRILLAEDNELNLEIAQAILEMNGFCVECARDGSEALQCYADKPPYYYDAILMDIRMPVMDGLESTKHIRTLGRPDSRSITIIALTANAFNEDTKESIESGMDGHMSKPIHVPQMMRLLSELLQKNRRQGPL